MYVSKILTIEFLWDLPFYYSNLCGYYYMYMYM